MPEDPADESSITLPRDATRFLLNPDANAKSNYGWTVQNVDFKTDAEAFDAQASNSYWNIWKSGAFTSSMEQSVNTLPEGTYVFSALLRGQNTATMSLTASTSATADAPASTVSKSITGTGATPQAGAQYPQGWQLVSTGPIQLSRGQVLTVRLDVKTSATAWWSADHFQLTLVDIPEERTAIRQVATEDRTANPSNGQFFDLSGRRFTYPAHPSALTKGLYIVNGRKILFK